MDKHTTLSIANSLQKAADTAVPYLTAMISVNDLKDAASVIKNLQAQVEAIKEQRNKMLSWEQVGTLQSRLWGAIVEQANEITQLKSELDGLKASRIAYAKEFPLNKDGEPDVGNIHANIRHLKLQLYEKEDGKV